MVFTFWRFKTTQHKLSDLGPDPTKAPCKKAKQLRRERKLEKLREKGIDVATLNTCKNKEKQVEDFINELPDDVKHKLEVLNQCNIDFFVSHCLVFCSDHLSTLLSTTKANYYMLCFPN